MLEVVWRQLSGRTRCLVSLFSFPVSLIPFRSLSLILYLSPSLYSVHSSPHPSSVPPNSPPFFFLALTHLICLLPALASLFTSLSLSFQNPRWVSPSLPEGTLTPSLSLSLQRNQALVFSLPLCPLPPSFFSKCHDCIFNLGRLSFPHLEMAPSRNGTSFFPWFLLAIFPLFFLFQNQRLPYDL